MESRRSDEEEKSVIVKYLLKPLSCVKQTKINIISHTIKYFMMPRDLPKLFKREMFIFAPLLRSQSDL